jgi:hypothetical protein
MPLDPKETRRLPPLGQLEHSQAIPVASMLMISDTVWE